METVLSTIGVLIVILIVVVLVVVVYMFLEAIHNALKAIPVISEELAKIRKLLEKKEE
jgi:predicted PurR-regulated permease PerM